MKTLLYFLLLIPLNIFAQEQTASEKFWNQLKTHCNKTYEGEIISGGNEGDGFTGKKLVMHVRSCEENDIKIPFFVGEDKSRTWVLHKNTDKILTLKHDHRNQDGSEESLTQYGGTASNLGLENLQNELDELYNFYHEDRYRCSPIIRNLVKQNRKFY